MSENRIIQELFLNTLRREHAPVSIYLVNGLHLQGVITSFDLYTLLLKGEGGLKRDPIQMIYKHAIATVVPHDDVQFLLDEEGYFTK